MFSFACQKRTRKAPATFEAREAAGCGSLRLLCALDGTRILQAAAPTAPPCFGHWPRSSPLQTRGYTPLVTPKKMGSIQKIQVAPLKDFLCSPISRPLSRCCGSSPQGSRRACKLCTRASNFAAQSSPVKRESRKIRRFSGFLSIKNRSAKDAQSEAEGILNRFANIIQNDIPPVRSF